MLALALADRARDDGDAEGAGELYAQAAGLAKQANAEVRELSHLILPSALARDGLAVAIEEMVDGLGLLLTVSVTSDRCRPEIESNVYFVVAEALTNMSKHAQTQSGTVRVWAEEQLLHVDVRDDGVGGADVEGGGLRGIADRIAALGGRLWVESLRAAARGSPPRSHSSGERPGRRAPGSSSSPRRCRVTSDDFVPVTVSTGTMGVRVLLVRHSATPNEEGDS